MVTLHTVRMKAEMIVISKENKNDFSYCETNKIKTNLQTFELI